MPRPSTLVQSGDLVGRCSGPPPGNLNHQHWPREGKSTNVRLDKFSDATSIAGPGEMQAAVHLFQEAAVLDPLDVTSQNNTAAALEELNRLDEASHYYARALRAKPGDVEARHGLDRIHKRQSVP